jgi:hypothetical protein
MILRIIALIALLSSAVFCAAQVRESNVPIWEAVNCPNFAHVIITHTTISAGTWKVSGTANMVYTNASPGHNLGVAFAADVTTRSVVRLDGFSTLTGTVFSSHYGYQTGSPQRVITVSQPTVVNLVVFVTEGTGSAWGSIVATKE